MNESVKGWWFLNVKRFEPKVQVLHLSRDLPFTCNGLVLIILIEVIFCIVELWWRGFPPKFSRHRGSWQFSHLSPHLHRRAKRLAQGYEPPTFQSSKQPTLLSAPPWLCRNLIHTLWSKVFNPCNLTRMSTFTSAGIITGTFYGILPRTLCVMYSCGAVWCLSFIQRANGDVPRLHHFG